MKNYLPDGHEPYENKTMKGKLFERFGSDVIVSTLNGRADVVTFITTASKILQNYHKQQLNLNEVDEKELILKTAAKLIKNDIKDIITSKEYYPSPKSIEEVHSDQVLEYLPESLKTVL